MQITFEKLTKKKAKLYINLFGKSHCGKTYTALTIATNLSSANDKVLIIDTEDRAHYYADDFPGVNVFNAKNIKVSDLLTIVQQAQKELLVESVIIDSLTPFWDAMIEYADTQKEKTTTGARHGANWKVPKKTINTMTLALRRCGLNVITTSLGKDETDKEMKPTGKILPCFERPKFEPYLDIQIILDKNGKILETPKKLHHDLNIIFEKGVQINKEWCEKIKSWLGNGKNINTINDINDYIEQAKNAESEELNTKLQPQNVEIQDIEDSKPKIKFQQSKTTPIVDIEGEVIFNKPQKTEEQIQQEIDDKNKAEIAKINNQTPTLII